MAQSPPIIYTRNFLLDFVRQTAVMSLSWEIRMLQQSRLVWVRKARAIVYPLAALLPAVWVLTHPVPLAWLRPLCKDTWTILAVCATASILPLLFRGAAGNASSLLVIALTQAVFQAWCYNTGSQPALSPFQMWGILPATDSHLYYSGACELLNGQQITVMAGARHPYPLLLAVLLKIFGHDFRVVTLVFTIVLALATWSAFEVIRLRLGRLAAAVFLGCVTFYIRIHCAGLFITEQLALLYSLCAVGMLVESVARKANSKAWLYCAALFFLTQALNARPAAYLTLLFLVMASWQLIRYNLKTRGGIVVLSALAVIVSLLLHSITYYRAVASPCPSNAWYCIYGVLNGGTWADGLKHSKELLQNKRGPVPSDWWQAMVSDRVQGLHLLREECLSEIRRHPGKLLGGWWRAAQFLWSKNTPFRAAYPQMPSVWFTESARWCAVLGLVLSLFFLVRGGRLALELKTYQALGWLNLAALLGMVVSLPFAPPWDGETRIFAAALPLFFLLPASGVGGLYQLIVNSFYQVPPDLKADSQTKPAIGSALVIGGMLSIVIVAASWCLVGTGSTSKNRRHPVELMIDELTLSRPSVSSFDLRSLQAGYHLRVTDDDKPTWLPNISRKDFIQNVPRGSYLFLSPAFKQVPQGTEVVVLPYWILLVLDREDSQAQRFTPQPDQTGHYVWPPVYFSKGLHVETR
jgi:hypothetical protein